MSRPKKQATLFELGKRHEVIPEKPSPVSAASSEPVAASVPCPLCQTAMDNFTMDNRIRHVEECLSIAAIGKDSLPKQMLRCADLPVSKPEAPVLRELHAIKHETNLGLVDSTEPSFSDDKQQIVINPRIKRRSSGKVPEPKRKRDLGLPQKEMLRYVNSQPTVKRQRDTAPKPEDVGETEGVVPMELLQSSRKTEIPDLKTLKFPISLTSVYRLSVDAFCYKPHETIHQYFLSHFHSDHYGGITKKWCRERTIDSKIIYCSEITARLLGIRYSVAPCHVFSMANDVRYKIHSFTHSIENGGETSDEKTPGVYVTCIDANHCPGAVIFLFEGVSIDGKSTFSLHCGDFRVNRSIMLHPLLRDFLVGAGNRLENVYLDTTYMTPKYNFPKQEQVCGAVADLIHEFSNNDGLVKEVFGNSLQSRITDFLLLRTKAKPKKYLILVGTYLIGKEKLAVAILKRLGNSPIYVSNVNSRGDKEHIVRSYHDEYLDSVLTCDPVPTSEHDVMIHLVPMKIAGNILELHKYFNHNGYHSHFERCIGLRPTGWSFKTPEKGAASLAQTEPHAEEPVNIDDAEMSLLSTALLLRKQPEYTHLDVVKQNPNTRAGKVDSTTYRIYSITYSEHLSFRELSFFVVFFNIQHVIPTVNTSNPYNAQAMAEIIRRWETIRSILMGGSSDLPSRIREEVKSVSLADF
ncbi:hypothetical protein METBIDRAFT_32351 [Metschnikowia bicuspidata var. bicuspidata NRRL YB-4993]|uniref:DNA repair metallo-beta-lactamase domain-containing protein n=1 Tax=Metschnikowia bicuspidata var. bicuspidata NRRL YB-4993 TaxID=869754 RepID=A0A1A0H8Y2_9ASCO|nr:hypothetical protein METBIDRAFT_32351 [Metschnikowia bicuspidata var. bicuspidata NRRL YB-4993]OBA20342.1 hypothetical protein METBIDRAFT_32351 [Metschnikowia bicuspidata var. bicuspidata NRRL YB-4993]